MVCRRRCPTCKILFPTVNALHDHGNLTSHKQRPYSCEPCDRAFKTLSALQSHLKSNRRRHPKANGKTLAAAVVTMDDGGWNAEEDDDAVIEVDSNNGNVHEEWLGEYATDGWASLRDVSECGAQNDGRDPMFIEERKVTAPNLLSRFSTPNYYIQCPSAASNNISGPLPSVSEPTLPSPSPSSKVLQSSVGESLSKSDEATARARAALNSRFQVLGVSELDGAIDLLKSDICRTRPAEPSASKLDHGPSSIATGKSSPNSTNESKLPLNSLVNTTYQFTCPGSRRDFESFSGFVLHIENRSCKSSMCPEIEDKIYTCATQLFGTLQFLRP